MLTFFMSTAGLEEGSREQSVNVVVGDEDETSVTGSLPLAPYARR